MAPHGRSTGRLLIGPLAFAVSPEERARLALVRIVDGSGGRIRPIQIVLGLVLVANGLLQTLLGLGALEPRTGMAPVHLAIGIADLLLAPTCFFGLVRSRPLVSRSRLSGSVERTFAMYEDGLTFERPTSLVPWARVREISDVGDAFIVRTTLRRRILPKRIFEDGGDALWTYAASRMTGGRMLVVPKHRRVLRNSTSR